MEFKSIDHWDEVIWAKVNKIFTQAFGNKGAKSEKIIKNMFSQQICVLHILFDESEAVSMAITGHVKGARSLLIDYLAVDEGYRKHGIGQKMVDYLKEWSLKRRNYERIIIEVEYDENKQNNSLVSFWKNCGFTLTEYVHHYRWVPERYRAMYLNLIENNAESSNPGEEIFKEIVEFHRLSFRGK